MASHYHYTHEEILWQVPWYLLVLELSDQPWWDSEAKQKVQECDSAEDISKLLKR